LYVYIKKDFSLAKNRMKNSLILEKDTALLKLKSEFQAKLEEQQIRHTAAISDYENKVRELLSVAKSADSLLTNGTVKF